MQGPNGGGVAQASAVQPQATKGQPDEGVDRIPVFNMEKGSAFSEDPGGMILFDADSLLEVNAPDALFQTFEVHGLSVHNDPSGWTRMGRFGLRRAIVG